MKTNVRVNGTSHELSVDPRLTRPRVGRGREPGPLDPKSCYASWMVMPTESDRRFKPLR